MLQTRILFLLALVTGSFVAATGCQSKLENPFQTQRGAGPIRILVDNNNFLDVTIYAEGDGTPIRLGQVSGKSNGSFEIAAERVSGTQGLRLRVEPIGSSDRFVSPAVRVLGGEEVLLSIGAVLRQTYISVR